MKSIISVCLTMEGVISKDADFPDRLIYLIPLILQTYIMTQTKSTYIKQIPFMCKGHVLFNKSLNHTHFTLCKKENRLHDFAWLTGCCWLTFPVINYRKSKMSGCMAGWINKQINKWTNKQTVNERMNKQTEMNKWMNKRMDKNERTNKWMNKWIDKKTDSWMNKWTDKNEQINQSEIKGATWITIPGSR